MRKRITAALLTVIISVLFLFPMTANARIPEIMSSLKSDIEVYGSIQYPYRNGTDSYTTKISYQKAKKRFLFSCTYSNGNSTASVTMYMPVSRKLASYTVNFSETVRAAGRTAKISGSAKLNRKTYSDQVSTLRFSRVNRTSASKKIKSNAYQAAANSTLRAAFKLWEMGLETRTTLCFRNFGFSRITVFDSTIHTKEW